MDDEALHIAASTGDLATAKALIENGALVDALDGEGWTPLHESAKSGAFLLTRLLVESGASIGAKGPGNNTSLHIACANGCPEVAIILLNEMKNMQLISNSRKISSSFSSSSSPSVNGVESLDEVQKVLDINSRDDGIGATAFHHACYSGNLQILELLVKHGADINLKAHSGASPMHFASQQPNRAIDAYLLTIGCLPLSSFKPWPHHPLTLLGSARTYTQIEPIVTTHNHACLETSNYFESCEVLTFQCGVLAADCLKPQDDEQLSSLVSPPSNVTIPATKIYQFSLKSSTSTELNKSLFEAAHVVAASGNNMRASNNGGFHSRRTLFQLGEIKDKATSDNVDNNANNDSMIVGDNLDEYLPIAECLQELETIISEAVKSLPSQTFTDHQVAKHEEETEEEAASIDGTSIAHAWVNLNEADHFNGLHHHLPAKWSGAYYVNVPKELAGLDTTVEIKELPFDNDQFEQNNQLVKTNRPSVRGHIGFQFATTHRVHDSVSDEGAAEEAVDSDGDIDVLSYATIAPREGLLLIFPSEVKHAVMPRIEGSSGIRVSISFNVD